MDKKTFKLVKTIPLLINRRSRFRLFAKRKRKIQVHLWWFRLHVFGSYGILRQRESSIVRLYHQEICIAQKHKYKLSRIIECLMRFAQEINPMLLYTISIYLIDSTIDTMHRNAVPTDLIQFKFNRQFVFNRTTSDRRTEKEICELLHSLSRSSCDDLFLRNSRATIGPSAPHSRAGKPLSFYNDIINRSYNNNVHLICSLAFLHSHRRNS